MDQLEQFWRENIKKIHKLRKKNWEKSRDEAMGKESQEENELLGDERIKVISFEVMKEKELSVVRG